MKLYFYFTILLVMAITCSMYGQIPYSIQDVAWSFRSLSTGRIINDDLDLVYDPIELRFVDSLRLYTNLSNLTSGDEYLFCNDADNAFLLGASRKNPWMDNHWMSLHVVFQKSKDVSESTSDYTDLEDNVPPYGGAYTWRHTISNKTSYADRPDFYAFTLNNTILLDDITLGLRLSYGNWGRERLQSQHSFNPSWSPFNGFGYNQATFDHAEEYFYIDSNYAYLRWGEHGKFNTTEDDPMFSANGSIMIPKWGYELRGDVMFNNYDYSGKINDAYNANWNFINRYITNYSNMREVTESYLSEGEQNGSRFGVGVAARRTFNKQAERKNDGYLSLGVGFLFGSFDYASKSESPVMYHERYYDGTTGLYDYDDVVSNNNWNSDKGDGTDNAILINTKFNVPLIDGVHFGIGGSYSYYSSERTTKYAYDYSYRRDYEHLDNVSNADDYTYTVTRGYKADREYKYTNEVFMVPVGIEYKFTENKKWALRVGTIFEYYNYTSDGKDLITESKPYTSKYEWKNGTSSTTISDDSYTSSTSHYEYGRSNKDFYYGLGFNATDNLQIDIMGFFDIDSTHFWDVEFFKSLRLSFVMKW